MATFPTLPFDIHFQVAQHLDVESAAALRRCNRYFHDAINLYQLPAANWRAFLIKAEQFPCNRDLLACFTCRRLKTRDHFGDKQRAGRKAKSATQPSWYPPAYLRFCWDCAARHRRHQHSSSVKKGKQPHYLCWRCHRWSPHHRRCGVPGDPGNADYRDRDWVCWPEGATPELEALPADIQRRIFGLLGYRDALALSGTSRYFRSAVDPAQQSALHDRYRFTRDRAVAAAAAAAAIVTDPPRCFPCYACFRVRPKAKFVVNAHVVPGLADLVDKAEPWTRYCETCVFRLGHPDFGPFAQEVRSHEICDLCELMKVKGEGCGGCLETRSSAA
ncbi:hypothetical protein F4778DRAFT_142560 [Xylariomycetidae sp. FL2044]|nr:hypothetical protein F4778DRAFT_142560 [Xylariomycetidae sp. FL2044]